MGWSLTSERTSDAIQAVVDQVAPASPFQFCSDGYPGYEAVNDHRSRHLVAHGKSQTYSVEANNAELRCFVSQLVRRTRAFAKKFERLKQAIQFPVLRVSVECTTAVSPSVPFLSARLI
jgi:IS1 family transposase